MLVSLASPRQSGPFSTFGFQSRFIPLKLNSSFPRDGTIGFLSLDHCSKTNMRQMLEILKRVKVVGEVRLTSEVAIEVSEIPPSARPLLCDHCLSY